MRVVLLNQFYPPDVAPTGRYLHDLARALLARGHEVTCIASQHAYGGGAQYPEHELLDGVEVVRLAGLAFGRSSYLGKLADYAAYYARLALRAVRDSRPELVISLTTPPFVGLLGKLMAARAGGRHAHWIMDVYPDVMQVHGLIDGVPLHALRSLARASYAGASTIVTLGPAMAERLRGYTGGSTRLEWAPLWVPPDLVPWQPTRTVPLRDERGWSDERLVLMYSGNLGLGHRFFEFLEAATRLGPTGPRWAFAGSGRSRPIVERFVAEHPELPVELLAYAPEARLREHLCSADVHLISMDSRWEGTLLPSKLQASFAVGCPVIFVGGETQDMARWIRESGGGWVVGERDVDGLLRAVAEAGDATERARRGQLAHAFAEARFERGRNLDALASLFTA
jgi:glycosyltransferase involved in cell wall biosynthesis